MKGNGIMPKLDRLKEEIAYQKYFLSVAIAITIGLSGWLGINAKSADMYLIIAGDRRCLVKYL